VLEYGYLDEIFDLDLENPQAGRIELKNGEQFDKLRDDGLPAILFTGHLGNFELLPMAAAKYGMELQSMFRAPNNPYAASKVADARKEVAGKLIASGQGASFQLMSALDRGIHVGMLVDQKFRRGIAVPFFGKDAPSNPLLAKLARATSRVRSISGPRPYSSTGSSKAGFASTRSNGSGYTAAGVDQSGLTS
jgi:KDO2-lipid IV(A) lauroyltransferase